MKKMMLSMGLILMSIISFAQVELKVKSGDLSLDSSLTKINHNANKDFAGFKLDMKNIYGVTEEEVQSMKTDLEMQPSDIFMTLEISKSSGKTVDFMKEEFKANKAKGWGVLATTAGMKPGSADFIALKTKAKEKSKKAYFKNGVKKKTDLKKRNTKTVTKK